MAMTRPAFMWNTPGPVSRSPSRVNGRCASEPSGHTVSAWHSSSTFAVPAGAVSGRGLVADERGQAGYRPFEPLVERVQGGGQGSGRGRGSGFGDGGHVSSPC